MSARTATRWIVFATAGALLLSCAHRVDPRPERLAEPAARSRDVRTLRRAPHRSRVARHVEQTRLQPRVMPIADRYHPLLASKAMGSIAVGTVTEGYLSRAVEIPAEGQHHAILAEIRKRHTRFTTDEMRELLMCVAERVAAKHPGHKLFLGNLSRRGGGDIPWSVSHNNGRDADIAFLARTPEGQPATPHHLYHFNRKLEATDSPEPMVFDVAANWTMVKALLQCPKQVPLQKLFIARWLRYPILRYARAARESNEIRYAAAALLRQPRRMSPHSDHLHLRIGCPDDDVAEGCLDRSRAPAAAIGAHRHVQARLPAIRRAVRAEQPATRRAAAYLLGLYHDTTGLPKLTALLSDDDAHVRSLAVGALVTMDAREAAAAIDLALAREKDVPTAMTMADGLAQLGATELLARRLLDMRVLPGVGDMPPTPVRSLVLQQLAETGSIAAAHSAVPLLADPDPAVRALAQQTVERLTNRSTTDLLLSRPTALRHDDVPASMALAPAELVATWQRFLATIPTDKSHDEVVLDGFRARGLALSSFDRDNLDPLAIALSWEAPYRDNAARAIAKTIDFYPATGRGARAEPRRFWMHFLGRRRMIDTAAVISGVLAAEAHVAGDMSEPPLQP